MKIIKRLMKKMNWILILMWNRKIWQILICLRKIILVRQIKMGLSLFPENRRFKSKVIIYKIIRN